MQYHTETLHFKQITASQDNLYGLGENGWVYIYIPLINVWRSLSMKEQKMEAKP